MRKLLPRAVHSVLEQTTTNWELLILDDASNDGTGDYLSSLASPKIRVFRNPQRMGVPRSRNRLLREAKGDFISVLDADDWFYPEKIETHAALLSSDPEIGVVWGRARVESEGGALSEFVPKRQFVAGWDLVAPYRVVHSATTWRRTALLSVGGYDESLYCEEAPDVFLKVGDRFKQHFVDRLAAHKHLAIGTDFRIYWKQNQTEISATLLLKTLKRRYGITKGPLVDRIKQRVNDKVSP